MLVEREFGNGSDFLACVADYDKKKVSFLDLEQCRDCAQAGECRQWSFPHALGLLKEISLLSK